MNRRTEQIMERNTTNYDSKLDRHRNEEGYNRQKFSEARKVSKENN